MDKFLVLIVLVGIILLLYACKTTSYTAETLPTPQIVFGSGGGFTNSYIDYILLENGQIFKHSSLTKETVEFTKIKKREAQKYFPLVQAALLENVKEPGNMSYYLRYQTDTLEQSITWGNPQYAPRVEVQDLYNTLVALVKGKESKN